MANTLGNVAIGPFLNRDTFSVWQRTKSVLSLANSDISGMTNTFAGFLAMLAAKTVNHVTQASFQANDMPKTFTAWQLYLDGVNGAGTTTTLIAAAVVTGTLAAMDSIWTTLDSTLTNAQQAASQTIVFP